MSFNVRYGTGDIRRIMTLTGDAVGIGTGNPSKKLEVHGAGDVEIGVQSDDAGGRLWTFQSTRVSGIPQDGYFR